MDATGETSGLTDVHGSLPLKSNVLDPYRLFIEDPLKRAMAAALDSAIKVHHDKKHDAPKGAMPYFAA